MGKKKQQKNKTAPPPAAIFLTNHDGCHFVLVFFSPFSIAITSLGEERANLSAFRTFVRFVLVYYILALFLIRRFFKIF